MGLENFSLAIMTQREWIEEMMEHLTEMTLYLIEKTLSDVEVDMAWWFEDMCFNHGPLISPKLFEELMVPRYRRITDALRKYKVDVNILDSDGQIYQLIPGWLRGGMNCMFPIEDVLGVEFCGTMFEFLKRGSKNREAGYHVTFERIPAFKTPDQMNVWLWNVIDKLDDIDRETERLFHCKEEDAVLMAFPMNTNSCTKYWGCAFHDYCLAWSNPLQQAYEPPIGFRVEFWNPAEMKTSVKKDLEWQK